MKARKTAHLVSRETEKTTVILANPFIASVNNEQTVNKLWIEKGNISLVPSNGNYKPVEINKGTWDGRRR